MTLLLTFFFFITSYAEHPSCTLVFPGTNLETFWIKAKSQPFTFDEINDIVSNLSISESLKQDTMNAIYSGLQTKKDTARRSRFIFILTKYLGRLAGAQSSQSYEVTSSLQSRLREIKYGFYFSDDDPDLLEYFYPHGQRLRELYQKGLSLQAEHKHLTPDNAYEIISLLDIPINLKIQLSSAVEVGLKNHRTDSYLRGLTRYLPILAASENIPDLMDQIQSSIHLNIPLLREGKEPAEDLIFTDADAYFFFPRQVPQ